MIMSQVKSIRSGLRRSFSLSKDLEALREKLLRELGDSELPLPNRGEAGKDFAYLLELPDFEFKSLGLDLAVSLGIQGQWDLAKNCVKRYRSLDPTNMSALLFEMRCLLELERFTEVLALGQSPVTEKHHLISANYLMALSFEALNMFPQARSRLEAIVRQDPNFLDVSLRLSKLQGFTSR